jgi:UDPglucose 6-dehydrogenase
VRSRHLRFAADPVAAVAGMAAVFIAVATPMADDGSAELRFIRDAARAIARHLDGPTVIINKSTVPVDTGDLVAAIVPAERVERHAAHLSVPASMDEIA